MAMISNDMNRQLLRLPPRPRLRDWYWAGASAGLMLSMAEFAVAYPLGLSLPTRLAICVLVLEAGVSCAGAALVGFALAVRRVRISRSGLVGAVVGPQLFTSIAGGFPISVDHGGGQILLSAAGLLMASGLAAAAGWVAFRLADRLERRGIVASAPWIWGGAGMLLAVCEWMFSAETFSVAFSLIGAIAAVLTVSAVAWVWGMGEAAHQRSSPTARPFGWLFGWLAVAALSFAFAPVASPWLLYDSDSATRKDGPPNLLVVAIPAAKGTEAGSAGITPTFESLGAAGRRYQLGPETPLAAVRALLADAKGDAVAPQLAAAGYVTASIFPNEEILPELARTETDARRGGRGLLEGRLRWLAVAPLLQGPAAALLGVLRIDTIHRSAEQVARRARHWLLEWRSDRSAAPFLLFVDLRQPSPQGGEKPLAEQSDACLSGLLEDLELLEAANSTLVVALRVPAEGDPQSVQVAMYGREDWLLPSGLSGTQRVHARTLGQFLLATSRMDILPSAGSAR
jgi:hypothetical protein